jgi:cbb3-type cytochrome oxidase maturation protein
MSVVVVLIGLSMLVAGGFLLAFLWAVRTGQFDDRYTPSVRILLDDHPAAESISETTIDKDQDGK